MTLQKRLLEPSLLFILLLMSALWSQWINAEPSKKLTSFNALTINSDLPNSRITGITQDRFGYLWIASKNGLHRYDGYTFRSFFFNENNPASLSSNALTSIVYDGADYLYIGTEENGLNRFHIGRFTTERYFHSASDINSLSNNQIASLHFDSNNRLWIGTNNGLNLFYSERGQFKSFYHNPLNTQSLPKETITTIESHQHWLLLGAQDGLYRIKLDNEQITEIHQHLAASSVSSLFIDSDNQLWIGTVNDGLFRAQLDEQGLSAMVSIDVAEQTLLETNLSAFDSLLDHSTTNPERAFTTVTDIIQDRNGVIWWGTESKGVYALEQSGALEVMTIQERDPRSLSLFNVSTLFSDRSGLIWIGSDGEGINVTSPYRKIISRIPSLHWETGSRSLDLISDITTIDNRLIVATESSLALFENDEYLKKLKFDGLSDSIVRAIHDHSDRLWLGTSRGNLYFIDKITSYFSREQGGLINLEIPIFELLDEAVNYHLDKQGRIWAIGKHKIAVFATRAGIDNPLEERTAITLGNLSITTIVQETDTLFWFGTRNKGLIRLDLAKQEFSQIRYRHNDESSLSSDIITSLIIDSKDNLVIGTSAGVSILPKKNRDEQRFRFDRYNLSDGLVSNNVQAIEESPDFSLWVSTQKGLSRIDTEQNSIENVFVEDGLLSNELIARSNRRDAIMYFASRDGLSIIDSKAYRDLKLEQEIIGIYSNITSLSFPLSSEYPVKLDYLYSQNDLEFKVLLSQFHGLRNSILNYRIAPLNEKWESMSNGNLTRLSNLSPGDYQLEFRFDNQKGMSSSNVSTLNLHISPPFWLTGWAKLLYGLLVIGALYTLATIYRQKNHIKNQQIERAAIEATSERLYRYFPKPLVERILASKEIKPARRCSTILFADLAGFTSFSEQHEPEMVSKVLNQFLAEMSSLVSEHNGLLNEVVGDGLVVLFGALEDEDNREQAVAACRLALDMQRAINNLSAKLNAEGLEQSLSLRIGIHQAFVTTGNFGTSEMTVFRAVGNGVNFTARLQSEAKNGEIYVSFPVQALVKDSFTLADRGEKSFKGFSSQYRVYSLVG